MRVLGIYGSPRKGGNTDILLSKALEGARSAGAEVISIYVRDLKMAGCRECGGCHNTGKCVIKDDMQNIYPLLESADVIFLASPIFFYGMPSQVKALIDRAQALWEKRMMRKTPEQRKTYDSGKGYLIAVGATSGKNLFEGARMTAKYFFDALDKSYEGELLVRNVDKKGAILEHPDILKKAFDLGVSVVKNYGGIGSHPTKQEREVINQ